jgi:subtilisin family serine protease
VLILDTGLRTVTNETTTAGRVTRTVAHPELADCHVHDGWISDPDAGDVDDEDEEFDPPARPIANPRRRKATSVLDFEAGHGTFIAGIVRQICPDAEIYSAGVLSSFGDGDVAGVISNLERALREVGKPIDVAVMSFGTNLIDDDPGFFGDELLRVLGGAIGVAAAGNQGTSRPYFPAALPEVIGVGGLAADAKAWFTNFGGWVDACAPAVDVISTFFNDFQEVVAGSKTRHYQGWARWSGTSFAAPKVAALIAEEMYLYGGGAHDAWKRLTSYKHYRYADLGIVFNV